MQNFDKTRQNGILTLQNNTLHLRAEKVYLKELSESPDLVVKGGDSLAGGCEFESRRRILA